MLTQDNVGVFRGRLRGGPPIAGVVESTATDNATAINVAVEEGWIGEGGAVGGALSGVGMDVEFRCCASYRVFLCDVWAFRE